MLDKRGEQFQGERSYLIVDDGDHLILKQRERLNLEPRVKMSPEPNDAGSSTLRDGEWTNQYRFTLQPHVYADYAEMCHYHQTSPESHFTRGRICSRATQDGQLTLSEMRFITTVGTHRQQKILSSEDVLASVLNDTFGIK